MGGFFCGFKFPSNQPYCAPLAAVEDGYTRKPVYHSGNILFYIGSETLKNKLSFLWFVYEFSHIQQGCYRPGAPGNRFYIFGLAPEMEGCIPSFIYIGAVGCYSACFVLGMA